MNKRVILAILSVVCVSTPTAADDRPSSASHLSPNQASLLSLPHPLDSYRALPPVYRTDIGPSGSHTPQGSGELIIYDFPTRSERRIPSSQPPWAAYAATDDAHEGVVGDPAGSDDPDVPGVLDAADFSAMNKVGNPDFYPRRTGVQLFISWIESDGDTANAICSGTLINPWYVLTAGHCVYDNEEGGGWPLAIGVAPARNGNSFPYGITQAVGFLAWDGWINGNDWDHDVALIRLANPVGALTGWRNLGYNTGCDWYTQPAWERYTYPGAGAYTGTFMYRDEGTYDDCETWGWEVSHDRRGVGGTSGGGAVKNGAVYAVRSNSASAGGGIHRDAFDTRLTPGKFSDIVNAMRAFEPDSPDLMAFDVKLSGPEALVNGPTPTLEFALFNNGEAPYDDTVTLDVYLSTDPTISAADILLGSHSFPWDVLPRVTQRIGVPSFTVPGVVSPGEYYLGVIITSPDSNPANNASPGMPVSVVCQQLGLATLVSPPNEQKCQDLSFTFDWTSIPGATGYRIQVGKWCGLGSIYQSSWSGHSVSGLSPNTNYHWRVRGDLPCGGVGPWSECFHFQTLATAPQPPPLFRPPDASSCQPSRVLLSWLTNVPTSEFQLQLGTSCGTGVLINQLNSSYMLENLSPNTTYMWRVRTLTVCDVWTPWSACYTFTTGPQQLSTPQQTSPVDDVDCVSTNTTFFWQSVPGTAEYELRLGTMNGEIWLFNTYVTTGLNYSPPPLLPSREYFWDLRAVDSCGNKSPEIAPRRFVTGGGPPPAPIDLEPGETLACSDSSTVLSWSAIPGASLYEVRYGLLCPTSQPLFFSDSTVTAQLSFRDALPETTVHWTVRARYACSGWGDWADCVSFDVRYPAPVTATNVKSTSHVVGTWSNNPQVDLNWFTKIIAGCFNTDAFSLLADFSPSTQPDTTPELLANGGELSEVSTLTLGEGDGQYIHVRPLDANLSYSAAGHFGPLSIDLTAPNGTLLTPNGGESLVAGGTVSIEWDASDALSGVASIELELSADGGGSFVSIGSAAATDSTFNWVVPVNPGALHRVRLRVTDHAGNVHEGVSDDNFSIVDATAVANGSDVLSVALAPASPNPFGSHTTIGFSVPGPGAQTSLTIYDAQGRPIQTLVNGFHDMGRYEAAWDGRSRSGRPLPKGVYFARLVVGAEQRVSRVLKLQ